MNHYESKSVCGLLHELGLSGYPEEVLAIEIEVDTNPPSHAGLMITPFNKPVPLNLQHHDPAALLAGKICAILQRSYLKGRDIYDLWWYLNRPGWPEPNLEYLNQCLQQGGWGSGPKTPVNWRTIVREQVFPLNWSSVMEDVGTFIIDSEDRANFSKEKLLTLLV